MERTESKDKSWFSHVFLCYHLPLPLCVSYQLLCLLFRSSADCWLVSTAQPHWSITDDITRNPSRIPQESLKNPSRIPQHPATDQTQRKMSNVRFKLIKFRVEWGQRDTEGSSPVPTSGHAPSPCPSLDHLEDWIIFKPAIWDLTGDGDTWRHLAALSATNPNASPINVLATWSFVTVVIVIITAVVVAIVVVVIFVISSTKVD